MGDSALGKFKSPGGNYYYVKKSKKEDPQKASDLNNAKTEIMNDILTEYFISLLGQKFTNLNIWKYELAKDKECLRIISKSFLNENKSSKESLFHGMELFEDIYDQKTLESPRNKKYPSIYLILNIESLMRKKLRLIGEEKDNIESIFNDFLKMFIWDAIIGNNDRHAQNWGFVYSFRTNMKFAPIYDTSRAFGWNTIDSKISKIDILNYVEKSNAHIGFMFKQKCNHFELIQALLILYPHIYEDYEKILIEAKSISIEQVIEQDKFLKKYFSNERKKFVNECYQVRINKISDIISKNSQKNKFKQLIEKTILWTKCKISQLIQ